jgi:hypothetical protein
LLELPLEQLGIILFVSLHLSSELKKYIMFTLLKFIDDPIILKNMQVKPWLCAQISMGDEIIRNDQEISRLNCRLDLRIFNIISEMCSINCSNTGSTIELLHFPPGSILLVHLTPMNYLGRVIKVASDREQQLWTQIKAQLSSLSHSEFNILLYRCDAEEKDTQRTDNQF